MTHAPESVLATTGTAASRVVLDTNVWLDLLVFDDPRVRPLAAALARGTIAAVASPAVREEWRRVLAYPQLALDAAAQSAALAAFDRRAQVLPDPAPGRALPRCADPDDQKFLVLADACGARWLLSRDRALLVLARRTRRAGLFDILTPAQWVAQRDADPAAPGGAVRSTAAGD